MFRNSQRRRATTVLRSGAIGIACLAFGCSTTGPSQPKQVATRNAQGFTVVEDVRVGVGVRGSFEDALSALEREDYARGIEALEQVAEDVPNSTAVQIDLAIAYGSIDDLDRADASIDRALALNPRHPAAHNERAILHRRSGRFDEARESYERALALFPEFHLARRNLAILCDLYLMDARCALEHYEIYQASVPGDDSVELWIADLRNRLGVEAGS
jgi:Tfp pilus assembly protein PilF